MRGIIPGLYSFMGLLTAIINVGGLILLATRRRWMALGMLAAFGVALLLVLIVSIYLFVMCMNTY